MRKLLAIVGALVMVFGLMASSVAATAAPANVGKVKITVLGTNARGVDNLSNRNSEYVWMKNVSADPVSIFRWKLTDAAGNETKFTEDNLPSLEATATTLVLPSGHSVLVYSGQGTDTTPDNSTHTIYRNGSHYLNNSSGETVRVLDADGTVVDKISYDAYGINPTP